MTTKEWDVVRELVSLLRESQEDVCSLGCPSVKRTGETWTHVERCQRITNVLKRARFEIEAEAKEVMPSVAPRLGHQPSGTSATPAGEPQSDLPAEPTEECEACHGTGEADGGHSPIACSFCGGTGEVKRGMQFRLADEIPARKAAGECRVHAERMRWKARELREAKTNA